MDDDAEQEARYQRGAALAEAAVKALPDEANSHYRHAFALGRYSQKHRHRQGAEDSAWPGKVRKALDAALELTPKHAEAHTALALYHAEIIGKIGALIGGMTYGAKASEADKHIGAALKLTPDSPIAHVEHGNLLLLLHGDKREDDAAGRLRKGRQAQAARCDGDARRALRPRADRVAGAKHGPWNRNGPVKDRPVGDLVGGTGLEPVTPAV